MRLVVLFCLILAALVAISMAVDFDAVARWAAGHQRGFQNQMAGAVRALRTGDPGALFTLLFAAASYGFVHAVGPGHGKALIGGVGLGSSVSTARLLVISLVSSLLQAFWAILLIYGGFALVEISARRMTTLAEDVLAPASYIAIASIGVILVWRGGGAYGERGRLWAFKRPTTTTTTTTTIADAMHMDQHPTTSHN